MATSQYRQGVSFENRTRERFEEAGYYVVRSAGSRGVADLVAFDLTADRVYSDPPPLMIQCKRGKGGLGVEAWNHFYTIADAAGCVPIVAQKVDGRSLEADLWRITGTRTPRSSTKSWDPWPIRILPEAAPEVSLPVYAEEEPVKLPVLHLLHDLPSSLCKCGHLLDDHSSPCIRCTCGTFREW